MESVFLHKVILFVCFLITGSRILWVISGLLSYFVENGSVTNAINSMVELIECC